ncbi:PBECR2 nuclease fold domain-containing protein, partial [Helicobacter sp. 13S00401-1]|uniref:PBECR2 nuclease fold domain-containing protein n=1 Tax=Helicobacter sp. 13S00401-1 TaxID=1905758 RepID=UPI00209C452B
DDAILKRLDKTAKQKGGNLLATTPSGRFAMKALNTSARLLGYILPMSDPKSAMSKVVQDYLKLPLQDKSLAGLTEHIVKSKEFSRLELTKRAILRLYDNFFKTLKPEYAKAFEASNQERKELDEFFNTSNLTSEETKLASKEDNLTSNNVSNNQDLSTDKANTNTDKANTNTDKANTSEEGLTPLASKEEGGINEAKETSHIYKPYTFTYKKSKDDVSKEVTASPEVVKEWIETLGLKSLEEDFIPTLPLEVKEALGGKEVKLTLGSFKKLVGRNRTKYIKELRPTLESPDMVFKDKEGMVIFIKQIDDKVYFTSINKEFDDYLIAVSNAPKRASNIENKFKAGGVKKIYQSPNFGTNSPQKAFTDITSSTNKTDIQENSTKATKTSQE